MIFDNSMVHPWLSSHNAVSNISGLRAWFDTPDWFYLLLFVGLSRLVSCSWMLPIPVQEVSEILGCGSLENTGDILSQFACFSMSCFYYDTNAVCLIAHLSSYTTIPTMHSELDEKGETRICSSNVLRDSCYSFELFDWYALFTVLKKYLFLLRLLSDVSQVFLPFQISVNHYLVKLTGKLQSFSMQSTAKYIFFSEHQYSVHDCSHPDFFARLKPLYFVGPFLIAVMVHNCQGLCQS